MRKWWKEVKLEVWPTRALALQHPLPFDVPSPIQELLQPTMAMPVGQKAMRQAKRPPMPGPPRETPRPEPKTGRKGKQMTNVEGWARAPYLEVVFLLCLSL